MTQDLKTRCVELALQLSRQWGTSTITSSAEIIAVAKAIEGYITGTGPKEKTARGARKSAKK